MSATSPPSRPARALDVRALTEPVPDPALNAFIAESKAAKRPWATMTTGVPRPGPSDLINQLIPVVIPLAGLIALLVVGGRSLAEAVWEFTLTAPFPLNLVIIGVAGLIMLGVLAGTLRVVRLIWSMIIPRAWWLAAYRMTRFAAANNLRYGHDERVSYPGVIFGTGVDRVAERRLTTTGGRRIEIGNYRYSIPAEEKENTQVYGWGYVAISLDRRLPHMLLDAKANDRSVFGIRTSNLPVDLARDQRISLGGEFDQKFTLYAPSEYGRDAFYVFTPDLMALFIDRLGTYDVEIIDDTMFLYGSRFDLLNPRTYAWLQDLVDTVVARTVRRTERYTDDFAALETDPDRPRIGADPWAPNGGADANATGYAGPAAPGRPPYLPGGYQPGAYQPGGYIPGLAAFAGPPGRPSTDPSGLSSGGPADASSSVFDFGGDGPPQRASNVVASGGRRLRRRTWGFWSVVAVLLLLFWIYNELVAPLFGLPRLSDH